MPNSSGFWSSGTYLFFLLLIPLARTARYTLSSNSLCKKRLESFKNMHWEQFYIKIIGLHTGYYSEITCLVELPVFAVFWLLLFSHLFRLFFAALVLLLLPNDTKKYYNIELGAKCAFYFNFGMVLKLNILPALLAVAFSFSVSYE